MTSIKVYNPGDIDAHFLLVINFEDGVIPAGSAYISGDSSKKIVWSAIKKQGTDV
jgi:hypothetical protein